MPTTRGLAGDPERPPRSRGPSRYHDLVSMVTVPKWLLAGLAVALGASVLAVAYLAGRESMRAEPAATAAPAPAPATEVGEVRPPNVAPDHAVERAPTPAAESLAGPPAAAALPADRAAAGRVAAYFARLDRMVASGLDDPSGEAAQQLLGAALQGDTTALDGLIADTERAEREVRAMVAPPECAEYHRELLASLADGRAILRDLKATLAGEDSDRLVQMSARAGA